MPKLEDLMNVEDPQERLEALLAYARTMKINVLKAKRPDGQYSEHELAVLIFGAEQTRRSGVFEKAGLLVFGLILIVGFFAALFLFLTMMKG